MMLSRELSAAVKVAENGVLQILKEEQEMLSKPPVFVEDVSFKCDCGYVLTYETLRKVASGGKIRCPYCGKVYRKR